MRNYLVAVETKGACLGRLHVVVGGTTLCDWPMSRKDLIDERGLIYVDGHGEVAWLTTDSDHRHITCNAEYRSRDDIDA
jgi:hypothetical protein